MPNAPDNRRENKEHAETEDSREAKRREESELERKPDEDRGTEREQAVPLAEDAEGPPRPRR